LAINDREMMVVASSDRSGSRRRPPWAAVLIVGGLATLLVFWGLGPWFAFQELRSAAGVGDTAGLEDVVDYPALRAALRPQVRDLVTPPSPAAAPPTGQRPWWLPGFIPYAPHPLQDLMSEWDRDQAAGRQVDWLTSPQGLAGIAQGHAWLSHWGPRRSRIDVRGTGATKGAAPTTFTFQRRGLYDWKLVHIRISALPSPGG